MFGTRILESVCKKTAAVCSGIILMGAAFSCSPYGDMPAASAFFGKDEGPRVKLEDNKKVPLETQVDNLLNVLTEDEKIGQLIMTGVSGTTTTFQSHYVFHDCHIGGVILYKENLQDADQIRTFTDTMGNQADPPLPLFMAIDEEGGRVVRMPQIIQAAPAQQAIAQAGDVAAAEIWAKKTGTQLRDLGINVNLAPVLDVSDADSRNYSSNPKVVAEYAASAAKGYQAAPIAFCVKHFPGLGRGTVDTHKGEAVIDAPLAQLEAQDIAPFQQIIKSVSNKSFMVMVSHAKYTALDAANPASLSKAVCTDLLRKKLGYSGVIITDALDMKAVSNQYSAGEAAVKAIQAGADVVLFGHDHEGAISAYMALQEALKNKQISKGQLNSSVRRILRMKLMYR